MEFKVVQGNWVEKRLNKAIAAIEETIDEYCERGMANVVIDEYEVQSLILQAIDALGDEINGIEYAITLISLAWQKMAYITDKLRMALPNPQATNLPRYAQVMTSTQKAFKTVYVWS